MTIWEKLAECVQQLDEPFRRSEIVAWFRLHHPEVNESSLAVHIQGATAGVPSRGGFGSRTPLIERLDRGLYRRFTAIEDTAEVAPRTPAPPPVPTTPQASMSPETPGRASVVLVGCVKSKRSVPCRAADLYVSSLFQRRRAYAERSGAPWFILSAEHGLVDPETLLEPYDRRLSDQSAAYRQAWGEWVVVRLEEAVGGLHGRGVEIHAGEAYVAAVRGPLERRGARIATPLAGLGQGKQLAWYTAGASRTEGALDAPAQSAPTSAIAVDFDQLVRQLQDSTRSMSPSQLVSTPRNQLAVPGLYSWWVDSAGAQSLSVGLGTGISSGLIYAGQAGATRWPSGRRSTNTLWGRLVGRHLGGRASFSTFRLTLASVLVAPLGLDGLDDPRLTDWMHQHLSVIAVPFVDADRLGEVEGAVLERLSPPLNLRGMPPSDVRSVLKQLRRRHAGRPRPTTPGLGL
jgi:hypothetical protein